MTSRILIICGGITVHALGPAAIIVAGGIAAGIALYGAAKARHEKGLPHSKGESTPNPLQNAKN